MFDMMSQHPVAIQNDEEEQPIPLLQLPPLFSDWCGVWRFHAGGGDDLSLCLAEPYDNLGRGHPVVLEYSINPFPVQFKSLVPGQKSRVFSRDI